MAPTARHPDRLIVTWRAAIEAAARRADIAVHGPYSRDETVHIRRVRLLKHLEQHHPIQRKWLLRRLLLFDKATARGDEAAIQLHGSQLVAGWDATRICVVTTRHHACLASNKEKSGLFEAT